jgi:hypothetical protein
MFQNKKWKNKIMRGKIMATLFNCPIAAFISNQKRKGGELEI